MFGYNGRDEIKANLPMIAFYSVRRFFLSHKFAFRHALGEYWLALDYEAFCNEQADRQDHLG